MSADAYAASKWADFLFNVTNARARHAAAAAAAYVCTRSLADAVSSSVHEGEAYLSSRYLLSTSHTHARTHTGARFPSPVDQNEEQQHANSPFEPLKVSESCTGCFTQIAKALGYHRAWVTHASSRGSKCNPSRLQGLCIDAWANGLTGPAGVWWCGTGWDNSPTTRGVVGLNERKITRRCKGVGVNNVRCTK